MTESEWYYARGGQQAGPVSTHALLEMARSGQVSREDLVWREGLPNWQSISTVAELGGTAVAAPAYAGTVPLAYAGQPSFVYAGFWLRFVAYIVDSILLGIVNFIAGFALGLVIRAAATSPASTAALQMVVQLIGVTIGWLYFALQESGPRQATPGKMILGLKVTDLEGQPISFGRATGRYFGKILSGLILLVGFIMAGFTERKQALHDIMAGCLVIKTDPVRVV